MFRQRVVMLAAVAVLLSPLDGAIAEDSPARSASVETARAAEEPSSALASSRIPEDHLLQSQTQRRLLAVVDALPEQDRRCLFLRADGLRYREIARILNISLGAVSLSLARSLGRIARSHGK